MGISRNQAVGFVEGYGRTWENWDFDGFVALFTDDVVYVEHPTDETVVGRDQMQAYIRAEYDDQGVATVQMGRADSGAHRTVGAARLAPELAMSREGAAAPERSCFPTDASVGGLR